NIGFGVGLDRLLYLLWTENDASCAVVNHEEAIQLRDLHVDARFDYRRHLPLQFPGNGKAVLEYHDVGPRLPGGDPEAPEERHAAKKSRNGKKGTYRSHGLDRLRLPGPAPSEDAGGFMFPKRRWPYSYVDIK